LTFWANGAVHAAGSWAFPEPNGDEESIVDLTYPAKSRDVFTLHVRTHRTVDVFDEATCTGYAKEEGAGSTSVEPAATPPSGDMAR
jgi:hypothetical protein